MAELTQKKRKGQGQVAPAEVISIEPQDSLYFMTSHAVKPAQVNLTPFATGLSVEDSAAPHKNRFIPFSGRPALIRELAPHIRSLYGTAPRTTIDALLNSLRWWWRYFDRYEEIAPVETVRDLNDIHYASYRAAPAATNVASYFFTLIDLARESRNLPPLYWTVIRLPERPTNLVSYDDVKRIYHFVKRPAFEALMRFEKQPDVPPTRIEIIYFFTLFVLSSGWNTQTALDVDVSLHDDAETLNCIVPHPKNEAFSYVRSRKERARGSVQYALSRNKSQLSPANIIRVLYRQTAPLRIKIQRYLKVLKWQLKRWEAQGNKTIVEINDRKQLIAELTLEAKSPWLYSMRRHNGKRRDTPVAESAVLIKYRISVSGDTMLCPLMVWAKKINSQLPPDASKVAENIVLSDLRDAYISWRWERSGYSWLDAMLAAGHNSIESLQRYLNKKQHRAASQRDFLKVGNALWETIIDSRKKKTATHLTTVVAAKVAGASQEQLARWLNSKDQTYVGTGCADFYNPPAHIAKKQQPDTGCRFQRCTLCTTHAILLPESYHHLAKRLVELRNHKSTISTVSWLESDYSTELENTEVALSRYDLSLVAASVLYWEAQIRDRNHVVLRMEGTYA